jgi:hypothetical protein
MMRYHGVLAAHANARAEVVPGQARRADADLVIVRGRSNSARGAHQTTRSASMGVVAAARVRGRRHDLPALPRWDALGEDRQQARRDRTSARRPWPRCSTAAAAEATSQRPARTRLRGVTDRDGRAMPRVREAGQTRGDIALGSRSQASLAATSCRAGSCAAPDRQLPGPRARWRDVHIPPTLHWMS